MLMAIKRTASYALSGTASTATVTAMRDALDNERRGSARCCRSRGRP